MTKCAMLMIQKVCKNSYFTLLNVLLFQEGLNLLLLFNFCFYISGSSERFNLHLSLPTILGRIFGAKQRNPVKMDRTRNVSYLVLRVF